MTLVRTGVTEVGLKSEQAIGEGVLVMGVVIASFHCSGLRLRTCGIMHFTTLLPVTEMIVSVEHVVTSWVFTSQLRLRFSSPSSCAASRAWSKSGYCAHTVSKAASPTAVPC